MNPFVTLGELHALSLTTKWGPEVGRELVRHERFWERDRDEAEYHEWFLTQSSRPPSPREDYF